MAWVIGRKDYTRENKKTRTPPKTRARPKQSKLPKKPRFEKTKSYAGNFKAEFVKASELT